MLSLAPTSRAAPLSMIVLGAAALGAGVWFQMRGVALPDELSLLTGAGSAFGIMARIGGPFCMLGLALAAFAILTASDDAQDAVDLAVAGPEPEPDPRPESGPARMAEWQRSLAEKAARGAEPLPEAPRAGGFMRRLHKAAIVMVGVALLGVLAAAFLGGGLMPSGDLAAAPEQASPAG